MTRSLDPTTFTGLATFTGLGLPADRAESTRAAVLTAMATLAPLDDVRLGETPPAAAFAASWE